MVDPFTSLSLPVALIIAGLLLGFSFLFSLVKVVFTQVYRQYDEKDHRGSTIEVIHDLFESDGFSETITQGRILANLSGAIMLYLVIDDISGWEGSWRWINQTAIVLLDWALVYGISVFAPAVLGNWKPLTLSSFCLAVFRIIRLPILIPALLTHRIYKHILASLGCDPRLGFLTETQRDAIQADASDDDDVLEEDERQMIRNIFDFVETPVREIMTPRVDMCALEASTPLPDVIEALNNERHSRLPVYRDSIDNVIGILSNREFLEWYTEHGSETFHLSNLLLPAFFVPHHKKIDDLLRELRKSGNQLAIVVDEYGGTAGLVTVEDILEEIVGDIKDEDDEDEVSPIHQVSEREYVLDPLLSLGELGYELDVHLDPPEGSHVETVSGLLQATLGAIPEAGTEVTIQGIRFRITKVEGTRLAEVIMVLPDPQAP